MQLSVNQSHPILPAKAAVMVMLKIAVSASKIVKKASVGVILLCITFFLSHDSSAQNISTYAGTGAYGSTGDGGAATAATFSNIIGIAVDSAGNVYLSDRDANKIRKIDRNGQITNFAGGGTSGLGDGGAATNANISQPYSVATDKHGNVYICDQGNQRLRKVDTRGIITTYAGNGGYGVTGDGGPATAAQAVNPCGVAVDKWNNVYLGSGDGRIRKVDSNGIITTFAGSDTSGYRGDGGLATAAWFSTAAALAVDTFGNLFVADITNNRIRKVDVATNIISTIAGTGHNGTGGDGGPATAATMHWPSGVACDLAGNVYIAVGDQIRMVRTSTGIITTVAGSTTAGFSGDGGPATAAELYLPQSVTVHGGGDMFIGDYFNHRVRKITNNRAPWFHFGRNQYLTVCENATAFSLNSILAASDTDSSQTIYWRVAVPPASGTVIASFSAASSSSIVIPSGTSYTPATGFSGQDSLLIVVTDGYLADSTIIHVNVIPVFTHTMIHGDSTICVGTAVPYTPSVSGGVWSCSSAGTLSDSLLTGVVPGIVYLTYRVSNACSADSAFRTIAVQRVVTPYLTITGQDSICDHTIVTFTTFPSNEGDAPSYAWYKNGIHVGADSTDYTCASLAAGDLITCQLTSSEHCVSSATAMSNVIDMTVFPVVTPFVAIRGYSGAIICQGSSVTLTAFSTNGGAHPAFTWTQGSTVLGTGSNLTYVPSPAAQVVCHMISDAHCPLPASVSDSVNLTVFPLLTPVVTIRAVHDTIAYPGEVVSFIAEVTYGGSVTSYEWFLNGNPVPGATDNLFSITVYERDSVYCVVNSNLICLTTPIDTSNGIVVRLNTVGTSTLAANTENLTLSPNPNAGAFHITGNYQGPTATTLTLTLCDVTGRQVYSGESKLDPGTFERIVDPQRDLPSGQYFLKVSTPSSSTVLPVLIQK